MANTLTFSVTAEFACKVKLLKTSTVVHPKVSIIIIESGTEVLLPCSEFHLVVWVHPDVIWTAVGEPVHLVEAVIGIVTARQVWIDKAGPERLIVQASCTDTFVNTLSLVYKSHRESRD